MKAKKELRPITLGDHIRLERKRVGLNQAELGRIIGLGEARVSKIENGAPITPEVASYILGKMGSEVQIKVVNRDSDAKTATFLMSVVYNFSKNKGISLSRAFRYLNTFKGLDYLNRYVDIERTLSYDDITGNLTNICAKNGGAL